VTGAGGLVGRTGELAAIVARAGQASGGRPGVVWIEGEAGAGKTALLRAAVAALAADFRVVRAQADELAADVSFDVVAQLGVRDASAPFPAGLDLIGQWAGQPDGQPVLVAVEDLHWADAESRLALLTAARRLSEDRVLMLVTSRLDPPAADGWERLRFDEDRCLRVPVGPLSAAEVAEMARLDGVVLPAAAAERLFRHTGGLALYVRTVLSELPAGELAREHGPLPAPRSLAVTTTARLGELPRAARELAAALAVLSQRVPLSLAARVAETTEPAVALDSLLTTGFVTSAVSDGQIAVEFAHPLYRAAVYDDLAPTLRQRLHRMAGRVLDGDAALAHRVSATDGVDEGLAQEAHLAAGKEAERQQLALAARYLLWASRLSPDRHDAESRLLSASRLLIEAGHIGQAAGLRASIEACEPSPMRDDMLGRLALSRGDLPAAERFMADSAAWIERGLPDWDTDSHRESAAGALARLAYLYCFTLRPDQAVRAAARALALAPKNAMTERTARMGAGIGRMVMDGPAAGLEYLAQRLPADPVAVRPEDFSLLEMRGFIRFHGGQLVTAIADLRGALRLALRHPGAHITRTGAHAYLAQLLFDTGGWDEALAQARVTLSLVRDEPQPIGEANAHAAVAWVLASRGAWQEAERHLEAVRGLAAALATPEAVRLCRVTEAVYAAARNDPQTVARQLGPLAGITAEGEVGAALAQLTMSGGGIAWWPWLIRALLDCDEVSLATGQLQQLERVAAAQQLDFGARIAELKGLLAAKSGDDEQAVALCREAVALSGPGDPVLDQALRHASLGRLLAARGSRPEAAAQRDTARSLLTGLGAAPFAERLADGSRTAGSAVPAAVLREAGALTARERDVASLAAQGLINTEIAAELYVSVNTVEYHLRNVFTKLGIRSRRDLRGFRGKMSTT
jgi:DNA-binding NarL/FixJ family response regulator/tetratricopeptide (TPR) repeat protein